MAEKLLSTAKVAEYLDMNPITVRRKAQSGEIPSIKIGNRLRFDKSQLDGWLRENSNRRKFRILVVDDEPLVGELFRAALEPAKYDVTVREKSAEALELIAGNEYDLYFLDLMIPEFDGAELFRRVRMKDTEVPVAIITGYPDSALMRKAMEHGPFTVLKKPFSHVEILSTVHSFIQNTGVKREI